MQRLILASQSKLRQKLMEDLGVPFEIIPAHLDEKAIQDPDPKERLKKLARAKAEKVAREHDGVIIAGDTIILFEGQVMEKPADTAEAKYMLESLSGKKMEHMSGCYYLDRQNGIVETSVETVTYYFRDLTDEEIDAYITTQPVLTWAAGFAPVDYGATLIARMEGSFTEALYGMPAEFLIPLLRKSGFSVLPK